MVSNSNGGLKPGFRWPVAVAHRIRAPADRLWDALALPGNLALCHPFCAQNPVIAWPGAASVDEVHYLNGRVFERRFCEWMEGVGYDLEIGRPGEGMSFVSWRIAPVDGHACTLSIAVYPYLLQNLPSALRWFPFRLYIGPWLRRYLFSVVRGFEWYVMRGEPVPRDQFGRHPWFSGPRATPQAS